MARYLNLFYFVLFIPFILLSCNNKEDGEDLGYSVDYSFDREFLVTNKILYDVPIVNDELVDKSRQNPDWFWENIPSEESQIFLEKLLAEAVSGKLKTYYYVPDGDYESFTEIPASKRKHFMDSVLSFNYQSLDEELSTGEKVYFKEKRHELGAENIKKLRFLEEWYLEGKEFKKRVIAVAPFFYIDINGQEALKTIHFWIFFNQSIENNQK